MFKLFCLVLFWFGFFQAREVARASLGSQTVKCLPAEWEAQVRSLGREDCLKKAMAIRSSILAWRIPWTEEPGSYSLWGCKELDPTE